ncbi:hypothetical protein [Nocardiopsis sp. RV163]|uniref:hypothetical protein n=1 Tax=Nocardiopsis sp. RV163 TaxID=1661388 RepID=UPI00064BAC36|nr:hypothetical protein [Nocardiopsis sp. RV163]
MSHSTQMHWDYRDGRVAAVVAALVYSLWVVEVILPAGGAVRGALADQDADFARFLESAHRIAAILVVIAAGIGLGLGARERTGHLLAVSWWCMVVFGAASLAATLLPGPCVVSTDVACATESLAEGLAGATAAQAVVAAVALLAALAGAIVLAVDRWRTGDGKWPLVAVVAALQLVTAVAVMVAAVRVYAAGGDGDPGVVFSTLQRLHLVAVALWLLTAGLLPSLWKRSWTPRRASVEH